MSTKGRPDDFESAANQVIDECDSTNDAARKLGDAGFPHGTWVSARRQLSGRGRHGREWTSLEGNLFLSMISRMSERREWTWIPLAAAVAVVEALLELYPDVEVKIKWPNDLWVKDAKLGGILCESHGTRENSYVVVGVGLNCAHEPEGLSIKVTSLKKVARFPGLAADSIRPSVLQNLYRTLNDLRDFGPSKIRARYDMHSMIHPGAEITWTDRTGVQSAEVVGLGQAGELMVRRPDGAVLGLTAEEVSIVVDPTKASGSHHE